MAVLAFSDEAVGQSGGCGDGDEEVPSFLLGGTFEEVAQHDQAPCQRYRQQSGAWPGSADSSCVAVEYCVGAGSMASRGAHVVVDSGGSDQRSW